MKKEANDSLMNDLLAGELARGRRSVRVFKSLVGSSLVLGLLAFVFLQQGSQREDHLEVSLDQGPTLEEAVDPPGEVPVGEFDELLTQLADAGPIIVTLADGSQELILTR